MAMQSFTSGSPEMIEALDEALDARTESYPMTLNAEDMKVVLRALSLSTGYYQMTEEEEERAHSLFSGIAETLGIEGV